MRVYQFYIELQGINPPIWRLIEVPSNYTFWELHVAIQDAMGWQDRHLHHFEIKNPKTGTVEHIGLTEYDLDLEYTENMLPDRQVKIAEYFTLENPTARYIYDYGDGWIHRVELRNILEPEKDTTYPRCIDGQRACPPEDCGGIYGYKKICEIIRSPSHLQHEETIQWIGNYDPEKFNPEDITFQDPELRWREIMG